jgi:predicted phosphoribosyltransferase
MYTFTNRAEAGHLLAQKLAAYRNDPAVCVLALPRGGVPVAFEIAKALHAPLDVFVVRKLGVPGQSELAMGAIASGGVRVLNEDVVESLRIPEHVIEAVTAREEEELRRREAAYRGDQVGLDLHNRIAILVDDGIATGATMRAAVSALARQNPMRTVVAVPVAPPDACEMLAEIVDEVVCLIRPYWMGGVGAWYEDFRPVADQQVRELLQQARALLVEDALTASKTPS